MFQKEKNIKSNVKIINDNLDVPPDNYTGCSSKLEKLGMILTGQEYSMKYYD